MKNIGDSIKGNDMSVYNDPRALQFSFMLVTYISIIIMITLRMPAPLRCAGRLPAEVARSCAGSCAVGARPGHRVVES